MAGNRSIITLECKSFAREAAYVGAGVVAEVIQ